VGEEKKKEIKDKDDDRTQRKEIKAVAKQKQQKVTLYNSSCLVICFWKR
jgi:hypothetical protein